MINYLDLNQSLKNHQISLTTAELHGLLSGFLCGALDEKRWKTILFQLTNDAHSFPTQLMDKVIALYQESKDSLEDIQHFDFQLKLDNSSIYTQADGLAEWVNHFLLGLGVAQPKLEEQPQDILEAVQDLREIGQLGYDEDDSMQELENALIEVIEYVQTLAMLFYTNFNKSLAIQSKDADSTEKKVLH